MSKENKDQINSDMISEEMLKAAVSQAFKLEDEIYDDMIEDIPKHEFSDEFYDKMQKLTGKDLHPNRKAPNDHAGRNKKVTRLKLRYLLIAALLAAMTCGTVMAVEPLREKVMQIIEKRFSDHTEVTFEQIKGRISDEKEVPDEFIKIEPAYVPEGYVSDWTQEDAELCWYTHMYINKDDKSFLYEQKAVKYYDSSITSDGSNAKMVQINEREGYLFQDEFGASVLLYVENGSVYTLAGTIEPKILIDIMKKTFE